MLKYDMRRKHRAVRGNHAAAPRVTWNTDPLHSRNLTMRITTLLAAAAVSSGAIHTATAQAGSRVRVVAPPAPSGAYRIDAEPEHRAAVGIGTSATGTLRDTLGLLITSVTAGSPAEKAGLEEGNRLAAINGTNLRTSAVDVEDGEMSSALTRRLTRELAKSKPGDEVSLSVYRDGRMQTLKVKTADSDVLFGRRGSVSTTRSDRDDRAAIGIMLGSTGSRRDTLGVLVMGITDSTPAARAGLEEGNRIAAINGVNLRVAPEDAGDHWIGGTRAERLQRAISDLKPGDNVTLKVYANGQFRDVSMKAARAGDLPRNSAAMFMGDGNSGLMRAMPAMPPMPARSGVPRTPRTPMEDMRMEMTPELRRDMEDMHVQLERIGPDIVRSMRPQMERLRMELPRAMEQLRMLPRMRMTVVV